MRDAHSAAALSPEMTCGDSSSSENLDEEEDVSQADELSRLSLLIASTDYIMEPELQNATLGRYFAAHGQPEHLVDCLSSNYVGTAQTVNQLAEWLVGLGTPAETVNCWMEQHLDRIIVHHFDPKKADQIFHQQEEGQIDWLPELIAHPAWRAMVYRLSEQHPECLLLKFAIKLISDAGYQNEICKIATAAHQIDIFSRILCTSIDSIIEQGCSAGAVDAFERQLSELSQVVCQSECTYLYTQALLAAVSQQRNGACMRRIAQELHNIAKRDGKDTTAISMALHNADSAAPPAVLKALASMLSKRSLNPADVSVLYNYYTASEPPPVQLVRDPHLMDLLIDAVFQPHSRLNPDHKHKYVYLLAYAASVHRGRDELKPTMQAVERAHQICCGERESSQEMVAEFATLCQLLRWPVVGLGVLHFIQCCVGDREHLQLHSEPKPIHLSLIDEIVGFHPVLHPRIFGLLRRLFRSRIDGLDVHQLLSLRKLLIDRLIHLMSNGYALPVIGFIGQQWLDSDTDISLIRYFVLETLDIIQPPYAQEFVDAFLPLVEHKDISGPLHDSQLAAVHAFIEDCKL